MRKMGGDFRVEDQNYLVRKDKIEGRLEVYYTRVLSAAVRMTN